MGENIGAAARVMVNFGLSDLRIVNPRDGWPNEKAIAMAAGASTLIERATLYDSVAEACHDLDYLAAATVRKRDMQKPVYDAKQTVTCWRDYSRPGILFGSERSGLQNSDIILADSIMTIPVDASYSSMNLAQSVAIIAYEYKVQLHGYCVEQPLKETASKQDWLHFFSHLETALDAKDFFKVANKKNAMMANIQTMMLRGQWNTQEIQTMRGIISALTQPINR